MTPGNTMDNKRNKKSVKRESRKTVGGIKLPPIEAIKDDDVETIANIDPDYYSLVQGRPIRPNTSINKYKQCIKDVALKRALHGFVVDEIIRIDREIETEITVYATASQHFEECRHSFDKFLAYDNDKTIVIMKKSDALAKDLGNQMEEHKKVSYEMASLKSKLQYIDETLLILLSLESFLHGASPILWQESENVKLNIKHSEIVTMDTNIFHKVDAGLIRDRLRKLLPPRLYFETPEQLLIIFDLLEKQNLNYLLVTEDLHSERNKFLKAKNQFKAVLHQELEEIQKKIKEIEDMISWNEIREVELKEIFFRILGEKIKYLVSSETVLQIFNYVEFAYEKLISPNDTKLSFLDMALALESEYDNLMLDLTPFNLEDIKEIEKETYESEVKDIKQAKEANKLLKEVEKLDKRLKSSYEPSRRKLND